MLYVYELEFVRDLAIAESVRNPQRDITITAESLIKMLRYDRQSQCESEHSDTKDYDCKQPELEKKVAELELTEQKPQATLIAPWPIVPDMGETYDHLKAVSGLPHSDGLPEKFGTTEYSAIKLCESTVAISVEHYSDFIAIREELTLLREDSGRLEATMMESARRHVALESLVKEGLQVFQIDGVYTVVSGAEMNRTSGDSLTDCLETAVTHMVTKCLKQTESPAPAEDIDMPF